MATYFSMTRGKTLGKGARRVLMGISLMGTPLALGLAGPVGAQSADSETTEVCDTASFGDFTLLNPQSPRTPVAAMELPAGVVTITAAHSWDAYPNRVNVVQLSEIWDVEFIAADGSVVGVSAPTEDVEDNIAEGHWNGSLGDTTLSAPAVGLRAHHRPDLFDDASINSVHASDITVCWQVEVPVTVPPTTVPPTTEPPTTMPPTTEPPTTEPPPPSGPTTVPGDACPLGPDGNPIDTEDPTCPIPITTTEAPPPSGPTTEPTCPLDSSGDPIDPSDPDCPQPTATTAPPPKGPSLPVTGSESTILLLGGLWMLAAGSTMVAYSRTR